MLTIILSDPLASRNYYFDTPVPYILLIFIVPLYMARTEFFAKGCRTAAKFSIAMIQAISAFFMVYKPYPYEYSSLIVARLLSGPYIIGYIFSFSCI
jgi:hypothetical protein